MNCLFLLHFHKKCKPLLPFRNAFANEENFFVKFLPVYHRLLPGGLRFISEETVPANYLRMQIYCPEKLLQIFVVLAFQLSAFKPNDVIDQQISVGHH